MWREAIGGDVNSKCVEPAACCYGIPAAKVEITFSVDYLIDTVAKEVHIDVAIGLAFDLCVVSVEVFAVSDCGNHFLFNFFHSGMCFDFDALNIRNPYRLLFCVNIRQ